MAHRPRFVATDAPHHITQRGNNRQAVFLSDEDRQRYLEILREHALRHNLRILGWCLMHNHVHLVAVPGHAKSMALALSEAHSRYSLDWNRRRDSVGHLWQNRFFSCPLDDGHLRAALLYVDRNPVRAKWVAEAWDWRWSSAKAHTTPGARDALIDGEWEAWMEQARLGTWLHQDWKAALAMNPPEDELGQIRRATKLGEPLGSDVFVSGLERSAGRRLRVWPRGRPAGKAAAAGGQLTLFG
jgi:putative transposase